MSDDDSSIGYGPIPEYKGRPWCEWLTQESSVFNPLLPKNVLDTINAKISQAGTEEKTSQVNSEKEKLS